MTPKEKAEELINKFYRIIPLDKMTIDYNLAKKCALLALDELLNNGNLYNNYNYPKDVKIEETIYYWIAIKQEIEEL